MRMPQLPPGTWTCHGQTYVGAARCRVCGRSAPVFGLVADTPQQTHCTEPSDKRQRKPSRRINRKRHTEIGEFLVSQIPNGN
jgi:hypothetical protein